MGLPSKVRRRSDRIQLLATDRRRPFGSDLTRIGGRRSACVRSPPFGAERAHQLSRPDCRIVLAGAAPYWMIGPGHPAAAGSTSHGFGVARKPCPQTTRVCAISTLSKVPERDLDVSAVIEAPSDVLYALVSDVTRMGEWSPENVGGRWLDGVTEPAVGARFRGANRRGWRRWSTTCTVVAAEPGRTFAFDVRVAGFRTSRWTYAFRAVGDGTEVTESWSDHRPKWLAILGRVTMGISDLRAHNEQNIASTLARLGAAAAQP